MTMTKTSKAAGAPCEEPAGASLTVLCPPAPQRGCLVGQPLLGAAGPTALPLASCSWNECLLSESSSV